MKIIYFLNNKFQKSMMNYGYNVNLNQTFQRILPQSCLKCQGDGNLYPFKGRRGISKTCNACNEMKVIE